WNLELTPGTLPTALTCALAYNSTHMVAKLHKYGAKAPPKQSTAVSQPHKTPEDIFETFIKEVNAQKAADANQRAAFYQTPEGQARIKRHEERKAARAHFHSVKAHAVMDTRQNQNRQELLASSGMSYHRQLRKDQERRENKFE